MRVSVIIPVYNAERFVRQAVESAVAQPETAEVILIEDASPDDCLRICKELDAEFSEVRLLQHSDEGNHGAGASRNLGIGNAQFEFVAFLDADDYYLTGRFSVAKQVFQADPTAEGIYEAVGVHFETEAARQYWRENNRPLLKTMTCRVPPEQLFEAQGPVGPYGACHLDGWVVRRAVFERSGLFDEHLRLHQDSVFWTKLAAVGRMLPGRLDEPVAMRRVHDQNRKFAHRPTVEEYRNRILMWNTLWQWGSRNLGKSRQRKLLERYVHYAVKPYNHKNSRVARDIQSAHQVASLVLRYPALGMNLLFWEILLRMALRRGAKWLGKSIKSTPQPAHRGQAGDQG